MSSLPSSDLGWSPRPLGARVIRVAHQCVFLTCPTDFDIHRGRLRLRLTGRPDVAAWYSSGRTLAPVHARPVTPEPARPTDEPVAVPTESTQTTMWREASRLFARLRFYLRREPFDGPKRTLAPTRDTGVP
jgi:hypothetical protein